MATGLTFSLGGSKNASESTPASASSPAPTNGTKRPHAALHDDSDDEDGIKHQSVTHFDIAAGGAFDVSKPKKVNEPLVIKPQANRDWKEASKNNSSSSKRQKYGISADAQSGSNGKSTAAGEEAERRALENRPIYGLNIKKSEPALIIEAEDQDDADEEAAAPDSSLPAVVQTPQTDDQRALDALLGKQPVSTLTIPSAAAPPPLTEDESFARSYANAPDMATLSDYTAVPVDQFGAALLRGMGWKEGQGIGNQRGVKLTNAKMPERRPALLGIGAKADAATAQELGAWNQRSGGKGQRGREPVVYNPLVMRNRRTGEEVSEEELKKKMEEQKERVARGDEGRERNGDKEKEGRRKRYDDGNSDEEYEQRRREKRREKETHRDDGDRYNSSHRYKDKDRYKSYDGERDKRRDDRYNEDRRRDKRKDGEDYDRSHSRRDRDRRGDDRDRQYRR